MAKKPISQKRSERQQQENQALQRVFNVFLLGLASECYLFLVYRGYIGGSVDSTLIWHSILRVLTYVGLAALVGGAAVAVWKRNDAKLRTAMLFTAAAGLFFSISGFVMTALFDKGVTAMCIAVPILTLLGLVYFLFQHECFLSTITLSGALFTVWICGNGLASSWRVYIITGAVAAVALLAVLAGLTYKSARDGGKLGGARIFAPDCNYWVLYGVYAVSAVGILAALLAASVAYYLLWVLGILLFVEMVYYTTKLM